VRAGLLPTIGLVLTLALLLPGCRSGPRIPPHPGVDAMWRQYAKLPPKRALAIAGDPNHIWVGAAAGGAEQQVDASDVALEECRRKRTARRMQAPCMLYAVGDEILWAR